MRIYIVKAYVIHLSCHNNMNVSNKVTIACLFVFTILSLILGNKIWRKGISKGRPDQLKMNLLFSLMTPFKLLNSPQTKHVSTSTTETRTNLVLMAELVGHC